MARLTVGEEIGNSVSHGVMMVLMLLLLPFAAVHSYLEGSTLELIGVSIFLISMFLMFTASTIYHTMEFDSKQKSVLKILDHSFIYVAIAGTYTPIALVVIGGWQGWVILTIQWVCVLVGILYKSIARKSIAILSLAVYLIMGWSILLFFPVFYSNANTTLLVLIALGGVLYTIGAIIYAKKGFKYHHLVWHLFINAAAICHAIAIIFFLV